MKFNIISEPSYSLAEIKLNDGESIVVEPGAMAWMDTTITVSYTHLTLPTR